MPKSHPITRAKSSDSASPSQTLYLVRHAIAADGGEDWPDDSVRPLTSKGAARMRQNVRGLRELKVDISLVLTSPLLRARQTADIVADVLKTDPKVEVVASLAPGGLPAEIADAVASHPKPWGIALVGHEPDLGQLAAWFLGANAPVVFKKGGVCRIDLVEPLAGRGQLIWHATPAMLRALAR